MINTIFLMDSFQSWFYTHAVIDWFYTKSHDTSQMFPVTFYPQGGLTLQHEMKNLAPIFIYQVWWLSVHKQCTQKASKLSITNNFYIQNI